MWSAQGSISVANWTTGYSSKFGIQISERYHKIINKPQNNVSNSVKISIKYWLLAKIDGLLNKF